jgi:putative transposase
MTAPRQILAGTTYLVTRRCAQRQFLLTPSATTNAIFMYVLAVAARRYGVRVHAFCALSNHFHLVVTDPQARLPAFSQYLDALIARAMNASLGRWEAFWAPASYSAVVLASPDDVVDKAAYVLANPVAAGLVRRGREWSGAWSAPEQVGGAELRIARPATFFRADGDLPETIELGLAVPPGFGTAFEFRSALIDALEARESSARQMLADDAREVVARTPVRSPNAVAKPGSVERRRQLSPRIAARDRWKRIEVLTRLVEFLRSYRDALRARRAGVANVVFPAGTYLLRIAHGVPCAAT